MQFAHENFLIDLDDTTKSRLFMNGKLMFLGDGYRAINMMIRSCKDPKPVQKKFKAQLDLREKPKFKDNEKPKE